MTKINDLRKHMIEYGWITKMIAAQKLSIFGLKEQLNRLKFDNKEIVTVMIPQSNGHPYARYELRCIK